MNGVIRLFEKHLNRTLQWFICQFHANELPLRHLFKHLDGDTVGPKAFSGIIGKALSTCENLPVVLFNKIETELPNRTTDISSDQQYLYDLCKAISTGICSKNLQYRSPGKMAHSRWLTTANRLLRLYIGTKVPSVELVILVTFVMKVYAPIWFSIKDNNKCSDGPRNLFKLIQWSRYLPDNLKSVVDPVIQRNGYFGHPESIILSMLVDDRSHIRHLAYKRIIKYRTSSTAAIRVFSLPKFNMNGSDYTDMIDWQSCLFNEPPITRGVHEDVLKELVTTGVPSDKRFLNYPCHSQTVERYIKVVTEASAVVAGNSSRDGHIRSKLSSLKKMPVFETKKDYVTS